MSVTEPHLDNRRTWVILKIMLGWSLLMAGALIVAALGSSCDGKGLVAAAINRYFDLTWGFAFWVAGPVRGPDQMVHLIVSPLFLLGLIIHFTAFFCLCWYWGGLKRWIKARL